MNTDNLKKEIRKVKVWHVALLCAGIFLAFAIIGTIMIAAGGGWQWGNGIHIGDFRNIGAGQLFEINDRGEQDLAGVDNIVIGTVSDSVKLQSGGSKIVAELKGQCRSVTTPVKLETRRDGNTVTIEVKYPRSINNTNTELTVTIPAEYMGGMTIGTVSGSIEGEGLPFKLQQVNLGAVSGGIHFSTASYTSMKAGAVSGSVAISGIVARTDVHTTSGSVDLDYADFAETTIVSVSGSVEVKIPEKAAFTVDYGTVSGGFRSSHPGLNISSADHGFSGTVSGGTALLKVNTTSGGFRIDGK